MPKKYLDTAKFEKTIIKQLHRTNLERCDPSLSLWQLQLQKQSKQLRQQTLEPQRVLDSGKSNDIRVKSNAMNYQLNMDSTNTSSTILLVPAFSNSHSIMIFAKETLCTILFEKDSSAIFASPKRSFIRFLIMALMRTAQNLLHFLHTMLCYSRNLKQDTILLQVWQLIVRMSQCL